MKDDTRSTLINLCARARSGSLSERELDELWPVDEPRTSFLDTVGEDLQEALAHFPIGLFSRAPDWKIWYGSAEHNLLLLDEVLLKEPLSDAQGSWHRRRLEETVQDLTLDEDALTQWIEEGIRNVEDTDNR
jgi:hypothetical protein